MVFFGCADFASVLFLSTVYVGISQSLISKYIFIAVNVQSTAFNNATSSTTKKTIPPAATTPTTTTPAPTTHTTTTQGPTTPTTTTPAPTTPTTTTQVPTTQRKTTPMHTTDGDIKTANTGKLYL